MAVIAMWKCDRDNSMFDNKKEAEAHDKMLELGAQFSRLLEKLAPQVDERAAEEFGLLIARNKELIIQACRGKPEAMDEIAVPPDNITRLNTSQ